MNNTLILRFDTDIDESVNLDSHVEFEFIPNSATDMLVNVHMHLATKMVTSGPLKIEFCTMCYGYDLAAFAESLRILHRDYDGSARFLNTVEDLEVKLTLEDKGRGLISVVVNYQHPCTATPSDTVVRACGFWLNQSAIPGIASDIHQFLCRSAISTTHPMLDET